MPTLRSSKRCQGPQGFNVSPIKSTRKVKKASSMVRRDYTNKVNNTLSNVPNTAVDSDASTVPLPTLPSLSGFGSLAQHPSPLIGY